jgi:hypothetical protein
MHLRASLLLQFLYPVLIQQLSVLDSSTGQSASEIEIWSIVFEDSLGIGYGIKSSLKAIGIRSE